MSLDTCIIVEPRVHNKLIHVVSNVIKNVPRDTVIQIYHGNKNREMLETEYKDLLDHKVFLYDMKVDNLTIPAYSTKLASVEFYEQAKGENILIFQTDTCINSGNKEGYKKFLDYDYVGGPWIPKYGKQWIRVKNNPGFVGNGGFSMRKKSSCIRALQTVPYRKGSNEDMYFVNIPWFKYPTDAREFSVEMTYHPNPFGLHKTWLYMKNWTAEERATFVQNFKDFSEIFPEHIRL